MYKTSNTNLKNPETEYILYACKYTEFNTKC